MPAPPPYEPPRFTPAPPPDDGRRGTSAPVIDVVTCRRLVLVDDAGTARMVAEVVGDTVELRLEIPDHPTGRRSAVVLHASRSPEASRGGSVAPLLGLQLWADGDVVAELDAWPDDHGRWRPQLHLNGGS